MLEIYSKYERKTGKKMTVDNQFVLKKLQGLENAVVVFSTTTKHPFIVCDEETFDDEMLVFASVEEMQKVVKQYTEKKYLLHGVTIPQDKLPRFLSECFSLGVNQLVYYENGNRFSVSLDKIVIRPDYSKLEPQKRPLLNAELQLSVLYFIQELSRRIPDEERDQEQLKEMEEELAANMAKAQFLVPIKIKEPLKPGEKREPGNFSLTMVNTKEGEQFLPIFSDVREYSIFNKENKYQGILMTIDNLRQLIKDPCKGLMLNPTSIALRLNDKMVDGILQRFFEFE